MTDDIVARLRDWSRWLDERVPDSAVGDDLRNSADEIERLRRDYSCICGEMRRMMDERDEARRMVCGLDADIMEDQIEYARHRGWDCFKENTDGR